MLRKTTGLFVSRLTLDASRQLATVFAWLAVAAEAAQSQRCSGAEELPAWQRGSSATQLSAAEYRTAKKKKKSHQVKGISHFNCVIKVLHCIPSAPL